MIVVLTYGKVGTTSLYDTLRLQSGQEVLRSHALQAPTLTSLHQYWRSTEDETGRLPARMAGFWDAYADSPRIQAAMAEAQGGRGDGLDVFTGVRDPIARSVSLMLEHAATVLIDLFRAPEPVTVRGLQALLTTLWTEAVDEADPRLSYLSRAVRAPLTWLKDELEEPFGVDLLEGGFEHEKGFLIRPSRFGRVALTRIEGGDAALDGCLRAMYPDQRFSIVRSNEGSKKAHAAVYRALMDRFRLPREVLEGVYASPYVSAFYTDAERGAMIDRWSRPSAAPSLASGPPTEITGTVVVPVLNHRAFVREQIDSLAAQWRPGLELIVVDDGSTDDSASVAREALAAHPNVASRLVRNAVTLGPSMLSPLLKLARGRVIIQADSDDLTLPNRLSWILAAFDDDPSCRLVTSNALMLNADGAPTGVYDAQEGWSVTDHLTPAAEKPWDDRWLGAAAAYHRSVFEEFPPLSRALMPYGLDALIPLRAMLLRGTHRYLATPLVGWRQHGRNSHRTEGVYATSGAAAERHKALMLMVYAQKVRDIEHRAKTHPEDERLPEALRRAQRTFMREFEIWTRLRNAVGAAETVERADERIKAPVLTLKRDEPLRLAEIDSEASWTGFNAPESWGVSTQRAAMVRLRLEDPNLNSLAVALRLHPEQPGQRLLVLVDFDHWIQVQLTQAEPIIEIELPERRRARDEVSLTFVAEHVVTTASAEPGGGETYGVGLRWIEGRR